MIVLGIDPGSTRIGYGLIKENKNEISYLASGLLKVSPLSSKQLLTLEKNFLKLIKKYHPDLIGIEKLYFSKNQKTALAVAQARGVIINVILKKKIPLLEFTPSQIKKAINNYGKSDKKNVARMITFYLNINPPKIDDISDALAIALTTYFYKKTLTKLS